MGKGCPVQWKARLQMKDGKQHLSRFTYSTPAEAAAVYWCFHHIYQDGTEVTKAKCFLEQRHEGHPPSRTQNGTKRKREARKYAAAAPKRNSVTPQDLEKHDPQGEIRRSGDASKWSPRECGYNSLQEVFTA